MSKKGQLLYKKAKKIIPGGTHLFSKRPEMLLPDKWPAYYSKADSYFVWDLEGNKYKDMSFYVGTNSLGYCHKEIDAAVKDKINLGNMATLNSYEEVELAQRLIDLHPWSDMARFARTGGEANSIAIRIARAATNNERVAMCGYHGWHDWYLSANLNSSDSLSGHLMTGLSTTGVPDALRNTVFPFEYNNIEQLTRLVEEKNIGTIKMEVSRNYGPNENYLESVRDLATKKGIVLIFDECTSGFRASFGGLHKVFNVEPDMAIFGKALGNGYAITGVIGKEECMSHAQDSFISSTYWTEGIGFAAALKTLEVMEKLRSWEMLVHNGNDIVKNWESISSNNGLEIDILGLKAIPSFRFKTENHLAYKTFITQEMLKSGFLASNLIYVTTLHRPDIMEPYYQKLDEIFKIIKQCEEGNKKIHTLLDGDVCHSGFKRLN